MPESNEQIIRKIEQAWNGQRLDELDQYFAPNFVNHAAVPGTPPGLAGAKAAHQTAMTSFPDRQQTIEDVVVQGDEVVVRTRTHGHNAGGVDWIGVPPNGKEFVMESIAIYRLSDGKVVETWGLNDVGALMAQLGGGAPGGTMPA